MCRLCRGQRAQEVLDCRKSPAYQAFLKAIQGNPGQWIVFGLGQQVGGKDAGICGVISDHQNLAWSGQAIDADPRDIQALVDMGRLELEGEGSDSEFISEKERLLKELEKHIKKEDKNKRTVRIKYAAEKYGKQEKEKEKDDQ